MNDDGRLWVLGTLGMMTAAGLVRQRSGSGAFDLFAVLDRQERGGVQQQSAPRRSTSRFQTPDLIHFGDLVSHFGWSKPVDWKSVPSIDLALIASEAGSEKLSQIYAQRQGEWVTFDGPGILGELRELPIYDYSELWPGGYPLDAASFSVPNSFLVEKEGKLYGVWTAGYPYARYVLRLKGPYRTLHRRSLEMG